MRRAQVLLAATAAAAVVTVVASAALATPGALDGALAHRGMVVEPYGTLSAGVAAAVQRDGKIVTAGEAELSTKKYALVSTRILPNGRLDPSYGTGGWVVLPLGGDGGGSSIVILHNGDILIGGGGKAAANQPLSFVAVMLQPNGQLDKTFGNQGLAAVPIGLAAIANAIAVQPNGKIVMGGIADDSYARFAVARLNTDGSLDRSFGNDGVTEFKQDGAAWGMGIRPDGSIVLAGEVTPNSTAGVLSVLSLVGLGGVGRRLASGQQYMAAAVLPNGQPDPSFGHNGVVQLAIGEKALCTAVAVTPDGKVILAGSAFTNTGISATVRLMADGSVDKSFAANGYSEQPLYNVVNAVTTQPDGKIVVATTGPAVIRLGPTGVPDSTFGDNGVVHLGNGHGNAANGVTYDPVNGDILLSGVATLSGHVDMSVISLRGS